MTMKTFHMQQMMTKNDVADKNEKHISKIIVHIKQKRADQNISYINVSGFNTKHNNNCTLKYDQQVHLEENTYIAAKNGDTA